MAKRMVLVDEKLLEYQPMLQHFQNKLDLQPTEQSVKSSISKDMKTTLDSSIPDDVKAKQYIKELSRYLHTKRKLVDEPETVSEPVPIKPLKDEKPPTRRSSRKRKAAWENW
jgi:hypothetical protein